MSTFIGIDSSITSTAICIEQDGKERFINYTTSDKIKGKWISLLEHIVEFRHISYDYPKNYSDSEKYKLTKYSETASMMVSELPAARSIGMEAYSQSSDAGHLIDLVTLGTFIRTGVMARRQLNGTEFLLYAPMTLKKETCRMAYNILDKKVWRNKDGLAGGSFKKPNMLLAMFDHDPNCALSIALWEKKDELMDLKNIPKPIDDLCDAYWLKELVKSELKGGQDD